MSSTICCIFSLILFLFLFILVHCTKAIWICVICDSHLITSSALLRLLCCMLQQMNGFWKDAGHFSCFCPDFVFVVVVVVVLDEQTSKDFYDHCHLRLIFTNQCPSKNQICLFVCKLYVYIYTLLNNCVFFRFSCSVFNNVGSRCYYTAECNLVYTQS